MTASGPRYSLRPSTDLDLDALLSIHESAFRPLVETRFDWDPAVQRRIVTESLPASQVIEVEGQAVGQLIVEDRDADVFLARVMLHPRQQGLGLGRRIVADLIARAAVRGVPVTLSVWENNRARRLYERMGFRVTHQEGFRVKMRLEPGC